MNWKDIQKDDKIYVLVPMYDINDHIIRYDLQESNIISVKEYEGIFLKFKITNKNNKRQRIQHYIYEAYINNECQYITERYHIQKQSWGSYVISMSKESLIDTLKKMIDDKIQETNDNIKFYNSLIDNLNNQKDNLEKYNNNL